MSMKIVSGNSNKPLAQEIAKYLSVPLLKATIKKFPDKEILSKFKKMLEVKMYL